MKKIQKALSGLLAGLMLFTSVPVSALPSIVSDSNTEVVETVEEENNPEIITEDISTDETADDAESESTESTEENTDENNPVIESSESTSEEETTESSENQETTTQEDVSEPTQSSENEVSELEIDKLTNNFAVYSDDEDEEITDPLAGWNISLLLYDQDVNSGKNGVSDLDWNLSAEENSYNTSLSKTIKMQIHYDNSVAPMDYEPGTITFIVPNLAYKISEKYAKTQLTADVIVGANDDTHTGYEWDFAGYNTSMEKKYTKPSIDVPYFVFTNAKTIEAGSNFEGSVQITYSFTSSSESAELNIEECIHDYQKDFNAYMMTTENFNSFQSNFSSNATEIQNDAIEATLKEINYQDQKDELEEQINNFINNNGFDILMSHNFPGEYDNSMRETDFPQYFYFPDAESITIEFLKGSYSESCDYIYVYDANTNKKLDSLSGSIGNIKKTYDTNNLKITFYSDSSVTYAYEAIVYGNNKELSVNNEKIKEIESLRIQLNELNINYNKNIIEKQTVYALNNVLSEQSFDMLKTNNITFDYSRTYSHPWKKSTYTLTESASKINNADLLPDNWEDYIWVKYSFHDGLSTSNRNYSYPNLYVNYIYGVIYEEFDDGCIVVSPRGNILTPDENGKYALTYNETYKNSDSNTTYYNYREIYVGYPKSIYNEENRNLNISNTAELWGPYGISYDSEYLNKANCSLNLSEFGFTYPTGNLAAINKSCYSKDYFYYQNITEDKSNKAYARFEIYPTVQYHGEPLTVKIADDILYCTGTDGNPVRLDDDDYYFSNIYFPTLYNSSWKQIPNNTYDCELWVRYAGDTEYTQYATFKNSSSSKSWSFSKSNAVVGYYFVINDMHEGLNSNTYRGYFSNTIRFMKTDIPNEGTFYNFCYEQVFTKNENGELVWINQWSEDNYSTLMTQMEIAKYDRETYSGYVQRAVASTNWTYYTVAKPTNYAYPGISDITSSQITQDEEKEEFTGTFKTYTYITGNYSYESEYFEDYDTDYMIDGISSYFLLPKGMKLESSIKEIKDSLTGGNYTKFVNEDGEVKYFKDIFPLIDKDDIQITITENWNSTGQTRVKIYVPLPEKYFVFSYPSNGYFTATFDFSISYDSYIEYGSSYRWYAYSEVNSDTYSQTNGSRDSQDINENGSTTDYVYSDNTSFSIVSVISTHQDVQLSASSTISNFASKTVQAEYGKEYTYKLRIRTGQNDVTNLVIYDNLERWTKNKDGDYIESSKGREYWQGTLQSVDTSYAESKGYTIKVWYSENEKAGTLAEDTSWKEYSDSVDKTKVKSLAFQYLNADGTAATVPGDSMTYVLINMLAPADEHIRTLAYNGCWTQWNAMDAFGQMVDDITGINSNTVKIALPNSVDADSIPSIELDITKEIIGTNKAFENLGLDPNGTYSFKLNFKALEPNENEEYVDINAVISNKGTTVVKLPVGSYLITEADDNYFDFVDIVSTMDPDIIVDGVTFEKTEQGYVITVTDDVLDDSFYTLKVTNEIEPERHYEETDSEINLFNATPVVEEQSLLEKFFSLFE